MLPKLTNRQMSDLLSGQTVEKGGVIFRYSKQAESVFLHVANMQGDLEPIGTLYESWFFCRKVTKKTKKDCDF